MSYIDYINVPLYKVMFVNQFFTFSFRRGVIYSMNSVE